MTRLLLRLALLALPFAALAGVIAVVDPFGFVGSTVLPVARREAAARTIDPALEGLLRYRRDPRAHVLFGDSRMANFHDELPSRMAGHPVANLGIGGASLVEVLHLVRLVAEQGALRQADVGIAFSQYSDYDRSDRTAFYTELRDNPALYFVSRNVIKATWLALTSDGAPQPPEGSRTREQFWQEQMDYYGDRLLRTHRHPDRDLEELRRIADWCRGHGVTLRFVVLPVHASLHERVRAAGLADEYARFKRELAALAPLVDFDADTALASDRSKFNDPVHVVPAVNEQLARRLWGAP
ncbi:MAG: hypothetical protein HY275_15115 [Gemmatimonadetes bacterium]|nr:hypothetical protein [Gemmatimonadota bacterium]